MKPTFPLLPKFEPLDLPPAQRSPDWRYQQAVADAVQLKFRLPGQADQWLRTLTHCLAQLNSARDETQRREVLGSRTFAELKHPLQLYPDREAACEIEARILARRSAKEIAEQLKLTVSTVSWYQLLFFDVESQLNAADYIRRFAISAEFAVGSPDTARRRVAMKALAYFSGPRAIDELFAGRPVDNLKLWIHPAELVKQLENATALERIAALYLPSRDYDPQMRTIEVAELVANLESQCSGSYPAHEVAYRFQSMHLSGMPPGMWSGGARSTDRVHNSQEAPNDVHRPK